MVCFKQKLFDIHLNFIYSFSTARLMHQSFILAQTNKRLPVYSVNRKKIFFFFICTSQWAVLCTPCKVIMAAYRQNALKKNFYCANFRLERAVVSKMPSALGQATAIYRGGHNWPEMPILNLLVQLHYTVWGKTYWWSYLILVLLQYT